MALHVERNDDGDRTAQREQAAKEQYVAGLLREAEMVARSPRLSPAQRASNLSALRDEIERAGGDAAGVPKAEAPAAKQRATRSSKQASARSKRGGAKADD